MKEAGQERSAGRSNFETAAEEEDGGGAALTVLTARVE